ncbi:unnamed protein product [Nezara viridula]|uniref:Uncharacterized protein n=1 Tax=Nezara viridula TaxID=85310 RepID=A0A9P0MJM1_NEZVI|nr:unnamed protein product [Nezara viridula]
MSTVHLCPWSDQYSCRTHAQLRARPLQLQELKDIEVVLQTLAVSDPQLIQLMDNNF